MLSVYNGMLQLSLKTGKCAIKKSQKHDEPSRVRLPVTLLAITNFAYKVV